MKSTYSPPEYLNFQKLFSKVSEFGGEETSKESFSLAAFINSGKTKSHEDIRYFYDLDNENRQKLQTLLKNPLTQTKLSFSFRYIELVSKPWNNPQEWRICEEKEIIYQLQEYENEIFLFSQRSTNSKGIQFKKKNLCNQILAIKCWQFIRDALCSHKIEAYIYYNNKFYPIPENTWVNDEHWYQLLVAGNLSVPQDQIFRDRMYTLNPGCITGGVFFKQEDVMSLYDSQKLEPEEKGAFHLWTPWLQLMSHFSRKYGSNILTISKDAVVEDMKEYTQKKGLDISKSDYEYMAKFIRDPQQRKGKAYKPEKF